jgi:hypothetical protein
MLEADIAEKLLCSLRRGAPQIAVEPHGLLDAEIEVQTTALRHVPDLTPNRLPLPQRIQTADPDTSFIGDDAEQRAHERGLAGPVGTEQEDDLPPPGHQRNVVEGTDAAIMLGDSSNFDHSPASMP